MAVGTVVVVTHNSGSHIRACLQALVPFTHWKVVIVDNNSTDDTIHETRNCSREVLTLMNDHNAGFAGAVNQAARIADGDVLVILNPDTIATVGSLDKLADALRAETVGAAGGHLLDAGGRPQKGVRCRGVPTRGSTLDERVLVNLACPGNPRDGL